MHLSVFYRNAIPTIKYCFFLVIFHRPWRVGTFRKKKKHIYYNCVYNIRTRCPYVTVKISSGTFQNRTRTKKSKAPAAVRYTCRSFGARYAVYCTVTTKGQKSFPLARPRRAPVEPAVIEERVLNWNRIEKIKKKKQSIILLSDVERKPGKQSGPRRKQKTDTNNSSDQSDFLERKKIYILFVTESGSFGILSFRRDRGHGDVVRKIRAKHRHDRVCTRVRMTYNNILR